MTPQCAVGIPRQVSVPRPCTSDAPSQGYVSVVVMRFHPRDFHSVTYRQAAWGYEGQVSTYPGIRLTLICPVGFCSCTTGLSLTTLNGEVEPPLAGQGSGIPSFALDGHGAPFWERASPRRVSRIDNTASIRDTAWAHPRMC